MDQIELIFGVARGVNLDLALSEAVSEEWMKNVQQTSFTCFTDESHFTWGALVS